MSAPRLNMSGALIHWRRFCGVLSTAPEAKVARLYRLIYNRPPSNEDFSLAREFLSEPAARPDRWQSFAQALLMANEFVFVD